MQLFPNARDLLSITIGSFHLVIAWYAVLILGGSLFVYYLSLRNAKKIGYDKTLLEDYFIYMMPLAILGARLWYVIFEWGQYASNPIRIFYIWEGGLAIHGGLIAGVAFSFFYFRKKGVNLLRIGDCIMPNLLLGQMIGRWGNFVNQEAFGDVVHASYFDHFPAFIKDQMFIDGAYRQPMFLYEGIGNLIGFVLIQTVFKKYLRKKQGDMIYAYVLWYGLVRFFVEIFRSDSLMIMGFKTAQIVSILFVLVGLCGILGVYNKLFAKVYPFKFEKPTIVFDLDGTLLDSLELIQESFKHTFETCLPQVTLSEEQLDAFIGPTLIETFRAYGTEEEAKHMVEVYRTYNHANNDRLVKVMPHAIDLLDYLKKEKYEIAIFSNKHRYAVDLGLKASKLDAYFEVVVCGDEVKQTKPNPEGILLACEKLCTPHDDVIYVGDGVIDIECAKSIGAYSIAYISNPARLQALESTKPSQIVYDLSDIKSILKEKRVWNERVN